MPELPRPTLALAALSLALLSVPPAAAQEPATFQVLGTDPTGDANANGVPMLDTWIDINGLAVATVGTDLVFHLGLEGTTTEVGSYCWMAAFEFDGTEYVGLDCYEGLAYESSNQANSASRPSTSRGTNVASSVVFDATGAVITIPLDAIGAKLGDTIEDIYGLTYATRALTTVDTVPDAKRDAAAGESLGSYVLGGAVASTPVTFEQLAAPAFNHSFAEATSETYLLNATVAWGNATVSVAANVTAGSVNVTALNNGTVLFSLVLDNATNASATAPRLLTNASGNWSFLVAYDGFVGQLAVNVTQTPAAAAPVAPATTSSGTVSSSGTASPSVAPASAEDGVAEAPGPGLALLVAALVGLAVALRRRRA